MIENRLFLQNCLSLQNTEIWAISAEISLLTWTWLSTWSFFVFSFLGSNSAFLSRLVAVVTLLSAKKALSSDLINHLSFLSFLGGTLSIAFCLLITSFLGWVILALRLLNAHIFQVFWASLLGNGGLNRLAWTQRDLINSLVRSNYALLGRSVPVRLLWYGRWYFTRLQFAYFETQKLSGLVSNKSMFICIGNFLTSLAIAGISLVWRFFGCFGFTRLLLHNYICVFLGN